MGNYKTIETNKYVIDLAKLISGVFGLQDDEKQDFTASVEM